MSLSPIFQKKKPFDLVSMGYLHRIFPHARASVLEAHYPLVCEALRECLILTPPMLAMALGTIAAETSTFECVREGKSKFNTQTAPFDLYDYRKDLGNQGPPDGLVFRGAGFVQLTGRHNFQRYGERIGVDLIESPALANEPKNAAAILALFLADREQKILEALARSDLQAARRLVNGGTHGIDSFRRAWAIATEALKLGVIR